jgi:hypothetical protein
MMFLKRRLGERFHTDTAFSFACSYPTQNESGLQSQGFVGFYP